MIFSHSFPIFRSEFGNCLEKQTTSFITEPRVRRNAGPFMAVAGQAAGLFHSLARGQ